MYFNQDFLIREMHARVRAGEREALRRTALRETRATPAFRRLAAQALLALAERLSPEVRYRPVPRRVVDCQPSSHL